MKAVYLALLSILALTPLAQSAPDCAVNYHFTNRAGDNGKQGQQLISGIPATSQTYNNNTNGCVAWTVSTSSEGLSGLSIQLESAPNSVSSNVSSPGSWVAFAGTAISGSNPYTGTTQGTYSGTGFFPWIRVNLASLTGTGSVDITLVGWKSSAYIAGALSSPPNGAAGGDLAGTYPNPTVAAAHFGAGLIGAPSVTFGTDTTSGFYQTAANTYTWVSGGGNYWSQSVNRTGLSTGNILCWSSTSNSAGSCDIDLVRSAAGVIAFGTGAGGTGGNIAITPGATVSGDVPVCWKTGNGLTQGAVCGASLRKYKTDIVSINNGLSTAWRLNPVTFKWKDTGKADMGLIADDVAAVDPLMGAYDAAGNLSNFKDRAVLVVTLRSVQQLTVWVASLSLITVSLIGLVVFNTLRRA